MLRGQTKPHRPPRFSFPPFPLLSHLLAQELPSKSKIGDRLLSPPPPLHFFNVCPFRPLFSPPHCPLCTLGPARINRSRRTMAAGDFPYLQALYADDIYPSPSLPLDRHSIFCFRVQDEAREAKHTFFFSPRAAFVLSIPVFRLLEKSPHVAIHSSPQLPFSPPMTYPPSLARQ